MESSTEKINENGMLRSLIIVTVMAITFLLWGLLLFYTVGDKGSPPWDFGIVEDIPGQSAYSTHPHGSPEPEPQHVSQKPIQAETELQKGKP